MSYIGHAPTNAGQFVLLDDAVVLVAGIAVIAVTFAEWLRDD